MEPDPNGSSLVVRGVEPGDEGVYTCQVSALTPILIQHRVFVRTRPVVQVEQAPQLTAAAESRAILTCAVLAGRPEPRLLWRKMETKVVIAEGGRLVFDSVTQSNGGTYTCEADNGYGAVATSSVHLTVLCTSIFNLIFFIHLSVVCIAQLHGSLQFIFRYYFLYLI